MEVIGPLILIGIIAWVAWDFWRTSPSRARDSEQQAQGGNEAGAATPRGSSRRWKEIVRDNWPNLILKPQSLEEGRGYVLFRSSDNQRLGYQRMRTSHGLKSFYVAGAQRREDAIQSSAFNLGEKLSLVPEPDNPHDEDAIAIYDAERETKAGYVPADETSIVHLFLEEDPEPLCIPVWEIREEGRRKTFRVLVVADRQK